MNPKRGVLMKLFISCMFFFILSINCIYPESLEDYISIAEEYHDRGDFERAIVYLERSIEIDPENARLYYLIGYIYYQLDDSNNAIRYLSQAIERNSTYAQAYAVIGIIYFNQENYIMAFDNFLQASNYDRENDEY